MKEEVHLMCQEEYGHLFVIRVLDVTDDTVLLQKGLLSVSLLNPKWTVVSILKCNNMCMDSPIRKWLLI
jgi:hypothetical protein